MPGSAELMAGYLEFAWLRKSKRTFVDRSRHSFEAVVRTQKAQHVHRIRARNSKSDRNARRDHDALGHENKLLRNHPHGE
jgi:hypothetical protein